jgi:O-methyltransferase involved in polyketide biosynthesis
MGPAARVLWFDAQVADALDSGTGQTVVVGAGYDSRAWRFRREGVQYFEWDHGATQEDKERRAPGPGGAYVNVDLTTRGAAELFLEHGSAPLMPERHRISGRIGSSVWPVPVAATISG